MRGGVVINWADFQLWALVPPCRCSLLQAPNVLSFPPQCKGLDRERGSFLLAANSRQSAQPLVILLRIHGVGKQGNLGKDFQATWKVSSEQEPYFLRKIYFCSDSAAISGRRASPGLTQHNQSHANTVFEIVETVPDGLMCLGCGKNINTLKSTAWLNGFCCVWPMWVKVGFGTWHNEVMRKEGMKEMCQWLSIFKTSGKCEYVPLADL